MIREIFFIEKEGINVTNKKGEIINNACEILKKTYKEVQSLYNEVEELLREYNENLEFKEEYSKGGKYLKLRNNHIFLFQEESDLKIEEETKEFFVLLFIFHDGPNVSRVNLENEPEIWAAKGQVKNAEIRYYNFRNMFSSPRTGFEDQEIRVGGGVYDYYWENDEKDEIWQAKFVGYPMVNITDREIAKEKLLDKLF